MTAHKIKSLISQHFVLVSPRSTREELVFICPQCGDSSGNRSVNLKSGLTSCWRCGSQPGHSGPVGRWLGTLGIVVEEENELAPLSENPLLELEQSLAGAVGSGKTVLATLPKIKLPAGFTLLEDELDSYYAGRIATMAERKHLALEDFISAGVGFTRQGAWSNYAIFPVQEYGQNVYYQGRTYVDKPGEPTKKFPHRGECPFGARHWVYGLDELRAVQKQGDSICVIVESILNVLSLRKECALRGYANVIPVCIFKHAISKEQAIKLSLVRGVAEFCLMFDQDAVQASYATIGKLPYLSERKFTVVEMPDKVDANDNAALAMDLFEQRQVYRPASAALRSLALSLH